MNNVEKDVRLAVAAVRTIEFWANGLLGYFEEDEDSADDFELTREELDRIIHNAKFASRVLAGFSEAGPNLLTPLKGVGTHTM